MDIHGISYTDSAARMRVLLKTGLLRHTDLGSNPERFFLAHRLLALHAPQLGPGFWIRFTVHYNLMAGSVLGLGSPEQVHPSTRFSRSSHLPPPSPIIPHFSPQAFNSTS